MWIFVQRELLLQLMVKEVRTDSQYALAANPYRIATDDLQVPVRFVLAVKVLKVPLAPARGSVQHQGFPAPYSGNGVSHSPCQARLASDSTFFADMFRREISTPGRHEAGSFACIR
jgi:hypothetical protein